MRTWPARDGATDTGGVIYYFSDHLKTASAWLRACQDVLALDLLVSIG
jgi:hypothetical protein